MIEVLTIHLPAAPITEVTPMQNREDLLKSPLETTAVSIATENSTDIRKMSMSHDMRKIVGITREADIEEDQPPTGMEGGAIEVEGEGADGLGNQIISDL